MPTQFAFATLVTSDHYLPGALALAAALKEVHQSPIPQEVAFDKVCIVTPETVDVKTIKLLRRAFDVVVGVEVIEEKNDEGLKLLGRPDLHSVLSKLHVFRLTQYEKVIFLDADVLPVRPLSHLFSLPYEFSAVPDVGWPDIFNSGVMVLTPGEDKFIDIMNLVRAKGSWDGGDQGVLNEWRGNDWNRLSFIYNTTPTAAYTYAPAYERFGSQISAIHFIGPNKPWKDLPYRAPSSQQHDEIQAIPPVPSKSGTVSQKSYAFSALVDRWFDIYDRHYRQAPEKAFEDRRYKNLWDEPARPSEGSQAPQPGAPFGLDELKQLALQGGSSATGHEGEGEYRSLPLEGRIDLMRPKQESPQGTADTLTEEDRQMVGRLLPTQSSEGSHPTQTLQPLPTPGPNEIPPSPYFGTVSLPPSTGSSTPGQLELGQPIQQPSSQPPSMPPLERRNSDTTPRPHDFNNHHGEHQQLNHEEPQQLGQLDPQQQHYESQSPPRPSSPPLLKWNPAIEPPPNEAPPVSAFRAVAYFPNVWDLPPNSGKLHQELIGQPAPDSSAFFQAPPPSRIPEHLIQEGHYSNIIDQHQSPYATLSHEFHQHEAHPQQYNASSQPYHAPPAPPPSHSQPDMSKVHNVFPWEERPIHRPGRVFPEGDSALPRNVRYIEDLPPEPEVKQEAEPTSTVPNSVSETKASSPSLHIAMPPPPIGFPGSKSFSNAWDSVASIQRYASRLVKPPAPAVQAPIPWSSRRRSDSYRSRAEQSDASSMDGDVEDEVDDDEEGGNAQLSDNEATDTGITKREKGGAKSPPSVSGSSTRPKLGKKDYRSFGVQTVPKDVRSIAVQVSQQTSSIPTGKFDNGSPHRHKKSSGRQSSRQGSETSSPSTSAHVDIPKPLTTMQELKLGQEQLAAASPNIANVQSFIRPPTRQQQQNIPSGVISPRLHDSYSFESPSLTPRAGTPGPTTPAITAKPAVQPSRTSSTTSQDLPPPLHAPPMVVTRTPSTETVDSSTLGPISPADSPVVGQRKRLGRTWDPATGVDVFKRASEEVLARFLRMGSWDEDSSPIQRA